MRHSLLFAMANQWILLLLFLSYSNCEWVLLPLVPTQKGGRQSLANDRIDIVCPDFHNLTVMGYSTIEGEAKMESAWKISTEDIKEFVEENEKIPRTVEGKTNFVNKIGETLMMEAEKRLKQIFHTRSRKARFSLTHFPTMEASLMTISMLLFGVYLSKLMVKLLQSHYTKYNIPIRAVSGIRTPILIPQSQRERSTELNMQQLRFMNTFDEYRSRFN